MLAFCFLNPDSIITQMTIVSLYRIKYMLVWFVWLFNANCEFHLHIIYIVIVETLLGILSDWFRQKKATITSVFLHQKEYVDTNAQNVINGTK